MHDDESIQQRPDIPADPQPAEEPDAAAQPEDAGPPLQTLKLPSVQHPVQPWITGEEVAVVNPGIRLWFLGMLREPLVTALIAVAVTIAGGAGQLFLEPQLTMGKVVSAAFVFGVIVFCFSTGIPSEIRVTTDGVGVRDWREAANGWPGRFFEKGSDAQFTVIASGTYLTAPGREPVRVRLPRFAIQRAGHLSGLRVQRQASWWIWMLLSWPGLFVYCLLPQQSIGGAMVLIGLVIRTFSRLRSGEAEEDLVVRP